MLGQLGCDAHRPTLARCPAQNPRFNTERTDARQLLIDRIVFATCDAEWTSRTLHLHLRVQAL